MPKRRKIPIVSDPISRNLSKHPLTQRNSINIITSTGENFTSKRPNLNKEKLKNLK